MPRRTLSLPTQPPSRKEAPDLNDSEYETDFEPQITPKEDIEEEVSDAEGQSSQGNREEPLPHKKPKVLPRHEARSSAQGTSTSPEHNTADKQYNMMASSGIRWQVAHLHGSKDDNEHVKKKKKKKSHHAHSKAHDPSESGSAGIVPGICAGILVLLCIVTGLVRLW